VNYNYEKMGLEKHIEGMISANGAYSNTFFETQEELQAGELGQFMMNFYPLTKAFALYSFDYAAYLGKIIQDDVGDTSIAEDKREEFLAKVLRITSVEFFTTGEINESDFHYNVFARLANKIGLHKSDLS